MVKTVKIFRNNKYINVPISEWFEEYYMEFPIELTKYYELISEIFNIKSKEDYKKIYDCLWIDFNYHKILLKYEELKKMDLPFEDDVVKFIAFLYGTEYFSKIGYPDLKTWLNAKDFNRPFEEKINEDEGFSLSEAVNYPYGQNAVKRELLSALKILLPQGG